MDSNLPEVRTAADLESHQVDETEEVLRNRWLSVGKWGCLVAPTGVGKSVMAMQMAILWSAGLPAFGIYPARPLRVLIIQAENDDGDMSEMVRGIRAGLGLHHIPDNVLTVEHTSSIGQEFLSETLLPLLIEHKPDLLILDPLLEFFDGDSSRAQDCQAFLLPFKRVLEQCKVAALVIHHTNKPPTGQEKAKWSGSDLSYSGSGSAVLSNSTRAVLTLRSVGSHSHFELIAAKRGGRLGWPDQENVGRRVRYVAHCKDGGMHWRDMDPAAWREELECQGIETKKATKQKRVPLEQVSNVLGEQELTYSELLEALVKKGISEKTAQRRIKDAAEAKLIHKSPLGHYLVPSHT